MEGKELDSFNRVETLEGDRQIGDVRTNTLTRAHLKHKP